MSVSMGMGFGALQKTCVDKHQLIIATSVFSLIVWHPGSVTLAQVKMLGTEPPSLRLDLTCTSQGYDAFNGNLHFFLVCSDPISRLWMLAM